jgi:hypothetical protein
MENLLNSYKSLTFSCYKIQIVATEEVAFDAWIGAIIRNNLLYVAEHIRIQKTGRTLREQIETLPLPETHPLYHELKEGFPKGYVLTMFSHADMTELCFTVQKGEQLSFHFVLIGNFNDYRYYFFEAFREMCERGIGKPMTPFQLSAISELSISPFMLSDFLYPKTKDVLYELTIHFLTPVILYRLRNKKNSQLSYQDKINRFPSFYQLMRSAFSRMQKLYALYTDPTDCSPSLYNEALLDAYLENAGRPLLKTANIQHISLPNTQKKETKNDIPLDGYIGEQTYVGSFEDYLPLLHFMEIVGVGNETVYGMGQYIVE